MVINKPFKGNDDVTGYNFVTDTIVILNHGLKTEIALLVLYKKHNFTQVTMYHDTVQLLTEIDRFQYLLSFHFCLDYFNSSTANIESFTHVTGYCGDLASTKLNCTDVNDTRTFHLENTKQ